MPDITSLMETINGYMGYLNIGFYVLILLPIVVSALTGLIRGFKKGLHVFIVRLIIYLVFILTLNSVVKWIFNMNLFGLPSMLYTMITGASSSEILTLSDLTNALIPYFLSSQNMNGMNLDIIYVQALVGGVIMFVLKIVWAIVYFLIIATIFRIIMRIIFNSLFKGKREYAKVNKDPLLGFMMGALNGLIGACVFMVMFGGLMSLISYTGAITSTPVASDSTSETEGGEEAEEVEGETSPGQKMNLCINGENYVYYLAAEGEGSNEGNSLGVIAEAITAINQVTPILKLVTNTWDENFFVKQANGVKISTKTGEKDENGEDIYIEESFLEKSFDEIIYIEYYVPADENVENGKDVEIRINLFTDINNILNSVLYILDDENLVTENAEGEEEFSLQNLSSERIEKSFESLSEIGLLKTAMVVALGVAINSYSDILNIDIATQNELYNTDWTGDLNKIGQVLGGFIDGGLAYILDDILTGELTFNEVDENGELDNTKLINAIMSIFYPERKDGENEDAYNARVQTIKDKIINNIKELNLLKYGSNILATYLVENTLKDTVSKYGLDEADVNRLDRTMVNGEYVYNDTYIDKLVSSINLSEDFGGLFELLFDIGDWNNGDTNNENYFSYFIKNYANITEILTNSDEDNSGEETNGIPAGLDADKIAELMDIIFSKVSALTFIQSSFDIAIKFMLVYLEETKPDASYLQYLTEENLFYEYIDWNEQLGEKIPNLVNAILDADILGIVMGNDETESGDEEDSALSNPILGKIWSKCFYDEIYTYTSSIAPNDYATSSTTLEDDLGLSITDIKALDSKLTLKAGSALIKNTISLGAISSIVIEKGNSTDVISGITIYGSANPIVGTTKAEIAAETGVKEIGTISWAADDDEDKCATFEGNYQYFAIVSDSLTDISLSSIAVKMDSSKDENWGTRAYLDDTLQAIFELKLLSNLQDTALTPLLTSFVSSLETNSFKIKISENIGKDGYNTYCDELLNTLSIVDDLVYGAKSKGASSLSELFDTSNLSYLIGGISGIDPVTLESSLILSPTIIYFLSTIGDSGDSSIPLEIPYIYEDEAWLTQYETNEDGTFVIVSEAEQTADKTYDHIGSLTDDTYKVVKSRGELYHIINALKTVASKDALIDLIAGTSEEDDTANVSDGGSSTDDMFSILGDITEEDIDSLFNSVTIQATITSLLAEYGGSGDSFSIVVPSSSKEAVTISKYNELDPDITILTDINNEEDENVVIYEDEEGIIVRHKKATIDYINNNEFKAIVRALTQIGDMTALMDSETMFSEIQKLDDDAVVSKDADLSDENSYYHNKDNTRKSKIDVMFESNILRCTISKFLTGSDYNDTYFTYAKTDMEKIDGVYYMSLNGVKTLFKSIFVIVEYIDSSEDIGTGLVGDMLSLTETELNTLFASDTLRATITDKVADTGSIDIPKADESGTVVAELVLTVHGIDMIDTESVYVATVQELVSMIQAVQVVFPDGLGEGEDFGSLDYMELIDDFLELSDSDLNKLFASGILRATISGAITDVESLSVPADTDVNSDAASDIIVGECTLIDNTTKDLVSTAELKNLIKALHIVFPDGLGENGFEGIDYMDLIDDFLALSDDSLNTLFASGILRSTITDTITEVESLKVPRNLVAGSTDENNIIVGRCLLVNGTEADLFKVVELKNLIKALHIVFPDGLGENGFDGIDYMDLIDDFLSLSDENLDTLFASGILRATITDTIVDVESLKVPRTLVAGSSNEADVIVGRCTLVNNTDTDLIKVGELKNLIKSLHIVFPDGLGENGFDGIDYMGLIDDFLSLSDENLDTLFASGILRATITDTIVDVESLKVPRTLVVGSEAEADVLVTKCTLADATSSEADLIKVVELKNLIKSLHIVFPDGLGENGFDGIDYMDMMDDFLALSDENLTTLFASGILRATITDTIVGVESLKVPKLLVSGSADPNDVLVNECTLVSGTNAKLIITTELKNLIKSLHIVFPDGLGENGFDGIDYMDMMDDFLALSDENLDALFASGILQATISDTIVGVDSLSVPRLLKAGSSDLNDVVVGKCTLVSDADADMVTKAELKNLIKSLHVVFPDGLGENGFDGIDYMDMMDDLLALNDENLNTLFASAVLRATISVTIIDVNSLTVPKLLRAGSTNLSDVIVGKCVLVDDTQENLIITSELKNLIKSLHIVFPDGLGSGGFEGVDYMDMMDDFLEKDDETLDTLFASAILQATISNTIAGVDSLTVPAQVKVELSDTTNTVVVTNCETVQDSRKVLITKADLKNLIKALHIIFPNGLGEDGFDGIDYMAMISDFLNLNDTQLETLFASNILRATISDQIYQSDSIETPYVLYGNAGEADDIYTSTICDIVMDSVYDDTASNVVNNRYVLYKDECKKLIKSFGILFPDEIDINNIGTDILSDLIELPESSLVTLFASNILRATLSAKIVELDTIVLPVRTNDGVTVEDGDCVTYVNDSNAETLDYSTSSKLIVTESELRTFIEALGIIFDGEVDLAGIGIENFKNLSTASDADLNTLVASRILRATISDMMDDLFGDGSSQSIIIPLAVTEEYLKYVVPGAGEAPITSASAYNERMINITELKAVIKAMGYFDTDTLGNSNDSFETIKLLTKESNESGKTQIQVILDSGIMQATLSDIVLKMTTSTMSLSVPITVLDKDTYKLTVNSVAGTYSNKVDALGNPVSINIISKTEILNMITAINYLDVTSIGSGGDSSFDTIKALTQYVTINKIDRKIDVIVRSEIILATLSSYIIDMDLSAMSITVPKNNSTLKNGGDASVSDPYLYTNISEQDGAENTMYILTAQEMKNFIIAASSIDIDTFDNDQTGAIKSLNNQSKISPDKTNIELIITSEILRLTVSNYLIDNLSGFGFSAIIFPTASLNETTSVKYNSVTKLYEEVTKIEILGIKDAGTDNESYELERLITGMSYLELDNLATDTLGTLSSLNDNIPGSASISKLDVINSSDILRYTLSAQITGQSITIPNEVYERHVSGVVYVKDSYNIYDSLTKDIDGGSMNLLKEEHIEGLITALSSESLDFATFSADDILKLDSSDVATLLQSKIIWATMSEKMKAMLKANDNISAYYNTYMETDTLTYEIMVSGMSQNENAISDTEIKDLFASLALMGQDSYETFDVSIENLDLMSNDGSTANDNDRAQDQYDDRAKFLRSLLIRTILTEKSAALFVSADPLTDYETLVDAEVPGSKNCLHVSFITGTVSSIYNSNFTDPATTILTLTEDYKLSFDPISIGAGEVAIPSYPSPCYYIYINGIAIDMDTETEGTQATTSSSNIDLSSYLSGSGKFIIKVVAKAMTVKYPELTSHNYNPYTYTEKTIINTSKLPNITNASITGTTLSFGGIVNADKYIITFNDGTTDYPITINKNVDTNGQTITVKLVDILATGSYTYSIQAESLNSTVYLNSDNYTQASYAYSVYQTLDKPQVEMIDNKIYFIAVEGADKYKVTLNGINYNVFTSYSVKDETDSVVYTGYYLDLSSISREDLPYGTYVATISTDMGTIYTEGVTTMNIEVLEPIEAIRQVENADGTIDIVFGDLEADNTISAINGADRYQVYVYRISYDESNNPVYTLCLYKETTTNSLDVSGLKKGYGYRVVIEAISTDHSYITNSFDTEFSSSDELNTIYLEKALGKPARHSLEIKEDAVNLSFVAVENASDYSVIIYSVGTGNVLTEIVAETSSFIYSVVDTTINIDLDEVYNGFTDGSKYKVVVRALSGDSNYYKDSELSAGKTFTYVPVVPEA